MSIPQTPSPLAAIVGAKTYNAQWFSGATKEAQIQAAINAIVADYTVNGVIQGPLYVYIPANMLPYNASLVTFNTAVRMVGEGMNPAVWDIRAYGAFSGATDQTAAIQAAVNGACAGPNPGIVECPAGNFPVSSTITITNGIELRGVGMHKTTLATSFILSSLTIDPVFFINSDNSVFMHNFIIEPSGYPGTPATAGAMIRVRGSTLGVTFNQHSRFRDLRLNGEWIGIDFVDASVCQVQGCYFEAAQFAAIQLDNPINPDNGDHQIHNNHFAGSTVNGAVGILHKGSGGLSVRDNKFFPYSGTGGCGYKFAWASATQTSSQLVIAANDFDNTAAANPSTCINFASAASAFVGVAITGNIIKFSDGGGILSAASAVQISQVVIAGNTFSTTKTTTNAAITINQLIQHVTIDANHFYTSAGNPTGVNIGNSVTNNSVFIGGGNKYVSAYQPWVINGGVIVTGPGNSGSLNGPADQATIAIDCSFGSIVQVAPTTNRTIGTPTNGLVGMTVAVEILNNSVGAIVTTWNGSWKLSGAWVDPAAGKRRHILFYVLDGAGNMREISRTAADQ